MIWLIGNRGMLGTDIEKRLKERRINYIASDKEVDIINFQQLSNFIKDKDLTYIVNCSAYTAVERAEDEYEKAFDVNAHGVLNIAQIANKKRAKLIHISTDYVFDGKKEGEYVETDVTSPINVYGKSKLKGEFNINKTFSSYFIIRTAWLWGKNGNNFVYTMLRLFKERDEVRVVSDQWSKPTYTEDLADIILRIIDDNSQSYGVYHFTNEGKTNWYNFAVEIYNQARRYNIIEKDVKIIPIKSEDYPTRVNRPKYSLLSNERIKTTFGIQIKSWEEAIQNFISNMRRAITEAS